MFELKNNNLSIQMQDAEPVVESFFFRSTAYQGINSYLTVGIRQGMEIVENIKLDAKVSSKGAMICYQVNCLLKEQVIASFAMTFHLENGNCTVNFDKIVEAEGYYLISIKAGRFITLNAKEAKVVIPEGGGRLLDAEKMECCEVAYQLDSKNPLLFGSLYNPDMFCVLETDSYENQLFYEAFDYNGECYVSLSLEYIHRLVEFELIEYGHRVPAISPDYYLKVQDKSSFMLTFGGGENGDVTWNDVALLLQNHYKGGIKPYYQDKIIGKILLDNGEGKERMTFQELESMIKRYGALMNNQPSVFYLVGWQYNGHDTGYPAIDEVNKNLGSREDLLALIKMAREYNMVISFHDNYDDAYQNSPDWCEDMISLDAGGNLMKCGFFVQGQAYLLSNYKYGKYATERAARTVKQYDIQKSYHIDVLAGAYKAGRRYDFNPASPASAKKNLEGKIQVIDEFAKHGVDITTEDLSSLFFGKVSHFWHMNSDNTSFSSEERIPLIPFICHGLTTWGIHGETKADVLFGLLYGACYSNDITKENFDACIDMYYLLSMPWMKLYGKRMQTYSLEGNTERIVYEDGSIVEVNHDSEEYQIIVDNQVIAKDFTTFIAQNNSTYLAYSRFDKDFKYTLPDNLRGKNLLVEKLLSDGSTENIAATIGDDYLQFKAEASVPYRITMKDMND